MFQRSGSIMMFAALLLTAAATNEISAGERMRGHSAIRPVRVVVNINLRQRPHIAREFNAYSGNGAIRYRRNIGTWSYGTVSSRPQNFAIQTRAKIIDISKLGGNADCSMERGVCVIRP